MAKKRKTPAEIQKLIDTRRRRSEAATKREDKKRKAREQEALRKAQAPGKRPPWAYPQTFPEAPGYYRNNSWVEYGETS